MKDKIIVIINNNEMLRMKLLSLLQDLGYKWGSGKLPLQLDYLPYAIGIDINANRMWKMDNKLYFSSAVIRCPSHFEIIDLTMYSKLADKK